MLMTPWTSRSTDSSSWQLVQVANVPLTGLLLLSFRKIIHANGLPDAAKVELQKVTTPEARLYQCHWVGSNLVNYYSTKLDQVYMDSLMCMAGHQPAV